MCGGGGVCVGGGGERRVGVDVDDFYLVGEPRFRSRVSLTTTAGKRNSSPKATVQTPSSPGNGGGTMGYTCKLCTIDKSMAASGSIECGVSAGGTHPSRKVFSHSNI